MGFFRRRPLVALFLLATLCIDALVPALKPAGQRNALAYLLVGALIGQAWVSGAWLVLGRAHRLARAAVFVAAMAVLATLVVAGGPGGPGSGVEWGRAFGTISIMGAAAAVAAAIAAGVLAVAARRPARERPLRFPVVELFGWTMVVALGSWAAGAAPYAHLLRLGQSLVFAVSSSAVAGMAAALATRGGDRSLVRVALPAAAVGVFLATYAAQGGIRDQDLYYSAYWAFAYVGAALAVNRLESRRATDEASDGAGAGAGDEPDVIPLAR